MGLDVPSALVGAVLVLLVLLIVDLAVAGGGMSASMMGAMGGVVSAPWAWPLLLLLLLVAITQVTR